MESTQSYVTIKRLFESLAFCPPVEDTLFSDMDSDSEGIMDDLEANTKFQVIHRNIVVKLFAFLR